MSMRNWYQKPEGRKEAPTPADKPKLTHGQALAIRRERVWAGVAALSAAALLLYVMLSPAATQSDDTLLMQTGTGSQALSGDCIVIQHLTFSPCGHELTRRLPLPRELYGKNREALESAYDAWRVTGFSPTQVTMDQQLDMYCPQHTVLMADEGGMLCIWQNTYGDALSLLGELNVPLSDFPDETQQKLRRGLGFASREELDAWLENAES